MYPVFGLWKVWDVFLSNIDDDDDDDDDDDENFVRVH